MCIYMHVQIHVCEHCECTCTCTYRMAFLWKQRTQQEKEQKRNLQEVNQLLLENILPAKVSKYYMEEEQNAVCGAVYSVPNATVCNTYMYIL